MLAIFKGFFPFLKKGSSLDLFLVGKPSLEEIYIKGFSPKGQPIKA